MFGQILSGKLVVAILAGVVATGGAAAAAVDQTGRQTGPVPSDTGKGNGQGAKISALAKSIPGGPGKGAQISAAARGHGQAVSAEAKKKAGAAKPAKPATPKP